MEFTSKLPFSLLFLLLTISAYAQNSPKDYVNAHNVARSQVGVPNIVWDARVARYARNYARQRKADCQLRFSNSKYFGENLAWSSGDMSGTDAVKLWLSQKKNYDYASNSCVGGKCLSYTQVVWKGSLRLGCAKARCYDGGTFVVCNYAPAGNIKGKRPY